MALRLGLPKTFDIWNAVASSKRADTLARLQWLLKDRKGQLSYKIADRAAEGGQTAVIDWLIKQGVPVGKSAVESAARHGQLRMVEHLWIMRHRELGDAVLAATRGGHLDVLEYLSGARQQTLWRDTAIRCGHVHLLRHFHQVIPDSDLEDAIELAMAARGDLNLEMVKYLVTERDCAVGARHCDLAHEHRAFATLQWIREEAGVVWEPADV